MTEYFFYGTLCHRPLLAAVLGRPAAGEPALLVDHAVRWAHGQIFPMLVPAPGAMAWGVLLRGVTGAEAARLDFYESGWGYDTHEMTVDCGGTAHVARIYLPAPGLWTPDAAFVIDDWAAQHGAVVTEAAHEVMAGMGQGPADRLRARYPQILIRAASRLRARTGGPTTLRRRAAPDDIRTEATRTPYAAFFAVEEADLRFRRFDGALSDRVTRAAFVSGDAATVLPYDPARDRVLLVEQFRMGPHARGDSQPWALEAIAGRVDPFETPADCARREAREEAGIEIGALHPVHAYYPSPGAKTEYVYSFVGLADLPDAAAGIGGLAVEGEDIRAHAVGFDHLMGLIESGEVENGPLVLTAWWLSRNRDRIRAGG